MTKGELNAKPKKKKADDGDEPIELDQELEKEEDLPVYDPVDDCGFVSIGPK